MEKLVAFRNVYKKSNKSPDYLIFDKDKEKIGCMFINKDKSGLMYFNILIGEEVWNSKTPQNKDLNP